MSKNIDEKVAERVADELTPVDVEEMYDEMLDDCYSLEGVGGPFSCMSASSVLKEVDPTAYWYGKNAFFDSLSEDYEEIDEKLYSREDVEAIREEKKKEEAKILIRMHENAKSELEILEGENERQGH